MKTRKATHDMRHIRWILVGMLALNVACGGADDRADDQDEVLDEEEREEKPSKDEDEPGEEPDRPGTRPENQDTDDVESPASDVSDDEETLGTRDTDTRKPRQPAPPPPSDNECRASTDSTACGVCVATNCCEESLSPPPQAELFACVSKNCSAVCNYD